MGPRTAHGGLGDTLLALLVVFFCVLGVAPVRATKLARCRRACRRAIPGCMAQTGFRGARCRRLLFRNCRRFGTATCEAPVAVPLCEGHDGVVLHLTGTYADGFRQTDIAPHTVLFAAGATFDSAPGITPLFLDGGADLCLGGGQVLGQFPRNSTWGYMHGDCCNFAGVEVRSPAPTLDGVRIDNVEDGVRVRPPADGFVVRAVHLSHIFDDAIDDHENLGGTVDDVLSDGSYVAISARPNAGQDGRGNTLTVRDSLFRLETTDQPAPGETPPAHGALFKWDDDGRSVRLVLENNVFVAIRSNSDLGIPDSARIVRCANNTLVWLGKGAYPGSRGRDPTTGRPCLEITTDRRVWDAAVAAWQARHPAP